MSTYFFKGTKRLWTPRDEEENRTMFSGLKKETDKPESQNSKEVPINTNADIGKWPIDMIIRLLRLYGGHKCLWNVRDEDFRNRKLRKAALVDISAAMGKGITPAQVVQKINVLRATYRYEKRRIKERMRKGIGAKTKLKWFALADSFLRYVPRIGKARKKADDTETDSDLEHEMILTIDPEAIIPYDVDFVNKINHNNLTKLCDQSETKRKRFSNMPDIKVKWTEEHSLKFVELIKHLPMLWSTDIPKDELSEISAINSISSQLGISFYRIKKRIKNFKESWNTEILKIHENPNYIPGYKWWPLAQSFMPLANQCPNFVDANATIPPTPLQIYDSPQTPFTPMNSTSSLPSIVGTQDYEMDIDFQKNVELDSNLSSTSNAKSFWKTPEDDLLDGKWSLKHSVKFLRLYGSHRCLWDLKDPGYRSRELRTAAIEDIATAMGHGLNADYVAKKIKIFRITYMQHRKRILAAIQSGQEPDIQLRWFPLADSFLRPHIGLRSIKEQELEIPQFDYQYVMANLNLIDPELLNDFRG